MSVFVHAQRNLVGNPNGREKAHLSQRGCVCACVCVCRMSESTFLSEKKNATEPIGEAILGSEATLFLSIHVQIISARMRFSKAEAHTCADACGRRAGTLSGFSILLKCKYCLSVARVLRQKNKVCLS